MRNNPATRKTYIAIAARLKRVRDARPSRSAAWLIGFDDAVVTIAAALAEDNPKFDYNRFMRATGVHGYQKNPPVVATLFQEALRTQGNPGKFDLLSDNVVEIKYQHKKDRHYYRHKFKPQQVQIAIPRGTGDIYVARLQRVDGKPLVSEY